MRLAIGTDAAASGVAPVSAEKTFAAAHIDSAGAAVLNAMRSHECCFRYDIIPVLSATVTVAGAGPKSIAEAIRKVSVTEKVAPTDAILSVNVPVTRAIAAKSAQTSGCGMRTSEGTDHAMAIAPAVTTART